MLDLCSGRSLRPFVPSAKNPNYATFAIKVGNLKNSVHVCKIERTALGEKIE